MTGTSLYEIGDTVYRTAPIPDRTPGTIVNIVIKQEKAIIGPGPQPETEGGPVVVSYSVSFEGRFIRCLEANLSDTVPA